MVEADAPGGGATRGEAGSAVVRKNSSSIYEKPPSKNLRFIRLSFLPVYLFLT